MQQLKPRARSPSPYNFSEQKAKGDWGEKMLDFYVSRLYHLETASLALQKHEVDRIAHPKAGGKSLYLEYKTDFKADTTGNAFIETIGSDAGQKNDGWATRSKADILIYYLPFSGRVFITPLIRIRQHLPQWANRYEVKQVANHGYQTHGLLIPLVELLFVSEVAKIPPQNPPNTHTQIAQPCPI